MSCQEKSCSVLFKSPSLPRSGFGISARCAQARQRWCGRGRLRRPRPLVARSGETDVAGDARGLLAAFDEAKDFAHGDCVGGLGQAIAAFGAAAGFDEASLLEPGEDQFQKLLRDFLAARDVGDLHRIAGGCSDKSKTASRAYSLFTEMFMWIARTGVLHSDCRGWRGSV